ncbi:MULTISPECIES: immunity 53 family protein [unclassified Streptomyces]|uniref:immunity 53 family protein n=1 Tax=unclassified Streptomyces TaxID=2593676 RepID=UPI003801CB36
MSGSENVLDWLQSWYAAQCDGDWEHTWGVTIGTLDNRGRTVRIDLEETALEDRAHPRQRITRGEHDRVIAWTSEKVFHLVCGPGNLTEALALFRTWATDDAVRRP